MFPIDMLFEISRWVDPKDVVSFGLACHMTLSFVRSRMRKNACLNELKNLFKYTPCGFIHKRCVKWSSSNTFCYSRKHINRIRTILIKDFNKNNTCTYRETMMLQICNSLHMDYAYMSVYVLYLCDHPRCLRG